MQLLKHTSRTKEIKPSNAEAIASAIINFDSPTRGDIAAFASISEMTVCRAIARLADTGLIIEEKRRGDASGRISFAENLRFIIIDLTFSTYSAYLLTPMGNICAEASYKCNPSADHFDNLSLFLERAYANFSSISSHFSGIGVIFKPDEAHKEQTVSVVKERFACSDVSKIDLTDALLTIKASTYGTNKASASLYYLCLGNRNFAYYVGDGFYIKSSPELLIDNNKTALGEEMNTCISPEMLYEIIFKIVNSASALLDAKLFIIESDRFIFGSSMSREIAEKLKGTFRDSRKICITDQRPHYYIKGALLHLLREITRNILSGD